MINYSIEIENIEVIFVNNEMPDYLKFISGYMIADENGINLKLPIYTCLPTIEDYSNYVKFENITEDQAIAWTIDSMGENYINDIKNELSKNMNEILNEQRPYSKKIPWI